jgi:hypothetical protein
MRHRPTDPSRRPRPTPANGIDETRARVREIDCGDSPNGPVAVRRADEAQDPENSAPGSALGDQPQAL